MDTITFRTQSGQRGPPPGNGLDRENDFPIEDPTSVKSSRKTGAQKPSRRTGKNRRFFDMEDRPRRLRAQIFSILTLITGLLYIAWTCYHYDSSHFVMAALYIAGEAFCLILFAMSVSGLWELRFKPPQGISPVRPYSVDIFIPTCGEPMNVIGSTLKAAAQIEWDGPLKIYVLDDGNSEEVKALAEELEFEYLSRPGQGVAQENAKAGNLNFGYENSSGELILALDSDQIPKPDIIQKLAGYIHFDKVAFVQSKQQYLTHEGDPFYASSRVFYDAIQLGMDNGDIAMSAGTGVLYRREALDDIGGFATWNLVEDLTSSYELHSKGWRSFYFPHALSRGLAPATIWGVYQQRGQWALDTMRVFIWDNPLFKKGLSMHAKMLYSTVALSYIFAGFFLPFFFCIPLWTYITGNSFFGEPFSHYLMIRLFYFATMIVAIHYLCYGRGPAKQFRLLAGVFPLFTKQVLRAFFYPKNIRKPGYAANNTLKARKGLDTKPALLAVLPQLLFIAANIILPFYAVFAETCSPRVIAGNIFLSAFCLWALGGVVFAALGKKKWAKGEDPAYVYGDS